MNKKRAIHLARRKTLKFQTTKTDSVCYSCKTNISYQIVFSTSRSTHCLSCSLIFGILDDISKIAELLDVLKQTKGFLIKKEQILAR